MVPRRARAQLARRGAVRGRSRRGRGEPRVRRSDLRRVPVSGRFERGPRGWYRRGHAFGSLDRIPSDRRRNAPFVGRGGKCRERKSEMVVPRAGGPASAWIRNPCLHGFCRRRRRPPPKSKDFCRGLRRAPAIGRGRARARNGTVAPSAASSIAATDLRLLRCTRYLLGCRVHALLPGMLRVLRHADEMHARGRNVLPVRGMPSESGRAPLTHGDGRERIEARGQLPGEPQGRDVDGRGPGRDVPDTDGDALRVGAERVPGGRARGVRREGDAKPRHPGGAVVGWPAELGLGSGSHGVPSGLVWPARRGLEQHPDEPPRTVAKNSKENRARLKGLGNAVVPECARAMGRLIVAVRAILAP